MKKTKTAGALLGFELKKLLGLINIAAFILLMAIKPLSGMMYTLAPTEYSKDIYHEYLDELYGAPTAEKEQYILDEKERRDDILSIYEDMILAYERGEITAEEYKAYDEEYTRAKAQQPAFDKVYQKYQYYLTLSGTEKKPQYFYDLEIIEYINGFGADVMFILFLTVFGLRFWGSDRTGGMSLAVMSSKYGRQYRDNLRIAALLIVSTVGSALSFCVDIGIYAARCGIGTLFLPLCGMEEFAACAYNVNILGYLLLVLMIRIVWSAAVCFMLVPIYKLVGNIYACITAGAAVIFLPLVLMPSLPEVMIKALAGTQLTGFAVLNNDMPLSIIAAVLTAGACYALSFAFRKLELKHIANNSA